VRDRVDGSDPGVVGEQRDLTFAEHLPSPACRHTLKG
jgi:hypothetical protein